MAAVPKTITMDEEVARRLAEQSRIEDRPMSRIVAKALRAYFETADGESNA
jgi:predicted transcriptional regulator